MDKKFFEVAIRYTDGTEEILTLPGYDVAGAETEAEAWLDYKKIVKDITAVKEVERRPKYK